MKIFILEDNPERMKWFNRKLMNHTVYHFDNAKKAIEFLYTSYDKIDIFFFDHDLENRQYVPSWEYNTGYTVAKELSDLINENGAEEKKIIVHSMNSVGAYNIINEFKNAEWVPFCDLVNKLVVGE